MNPVIRRLCVLLVGASIATFVMSMSSSVTLRNGPFMTTINAGVLQGNLSGTFLRRRALTLA